MSRISTRPIILPGFTFGRRPNSYTLTISPMIPRKHQHSPKKSTKKSRNKSTNPRITTAATKKHFLGIVWGFLWNPYSQKKYISKSTYLCQRSTLKKKNNQKILRMYRFVVSPPHFFQTSYFNDISSFLNISKQI